MGLLHVLGQLDGLDVPVADKIDFADADFPALVHGKVHADGAADHGIPLHLHIHVCFQIAFFLKVPLDNVYRGILHVIRILAAGTQVQTLLQVFPFTGFDAAECPAGHTGPLADADFEPGCVRRCAEGVYHHRHILKITLGDQALYNSGDILSGYGNFLARMQAGELQDLVLVEIAVTLYANASHNVFLGMIIIDFNATAHLLCPRKETCEKHRDSAKYLFQTHSAKTIILQR